MNISSLISTYIRNNKVNCKVLYNTDDKISIRYLLSVPAWTNDKDFIGNSEERSVLYAANRKKNIRPYLKNKYTIDQPYPTQLTNNKYFCIYAIYDVSTFYNVDIDSFLYTEYDKRFREIKGNILLEQIGDLSKRWEAVNNGVPNYTIPSKINYLHTVERGDTKYTDKEFSEEEKTHDIMDLLDEITIRKEEADQF